LIGQQLYTTPAENVVQPNPITADVGGNFYFCTNSTHFAMLIVSAQGDFWTPDLNIVDNWANGGTINGNVVLNGDLTLFGDVGISGDLNVGGTINATILGNASTATALETAPYICPSSGYYGYGITANGTEYCNPLYYQALGANGVGQTPRSQINFSSNFALTDSASPSRTNVDLASTITSNTSGNAATATTATTAGSLNGSVTNCGAGGFAYGISANGNALCNTTIKILPITISSGGAGICTTPDGTSYGQCSQTYYLSPDGTSSGAVTFSSTPSVACSAAPGTAASLTAIFVSSISTTQFTVTLQNGTAGGGNPTSTTFINCIAAHS
jgi:hypothetical protein